MTSKPIASSSNFRRSTESVTMRFFRIQWDQTMSGGRLGSERAWRQKSELDLIPIDGLIRIITLQQLLFIPLTILVENWVWIESNFNMFKFALKNCPLFQSCNFLTLLKYRVLVDFLKLTRVSLGVLEGS